MVAANEAVARWLVERGLPGVFRVHDAPDARSVDALAKWAHNFGFEAGFGASLTPLGLAAFEEQFAQTSIAPAVANVLGRALGPARYTVHPGMHFGLAAPLYLHFTSPIRRYADLAVHRIVKAFLAGRRDLHAGDAALEAMAVSVNDLAYRASKAENERVRMLAARLFAGRVGERFAGNVIAVKPFGLVVQLVGMAVTGTIATEALPGGPFRRDHVRHALLGRERTYSIGDALEVAVTSTQEDLGRIDLALA
jgi:ribonuclease R